MENKARANPPPKAKGKTTRKASPKPPPKASPKGGIGEGIEGEILPPERAMRVGRPSKYDPGVCQRILAYFNPERVRSKITLDEKGNIALNEFPTLAAFAFSEGVSRNTLHAWAEAHPDFQDAYARAREGYEGLLVSAGLLGAVNPQFASLTAKNTIGWRDKSEEKPEDNPLVRLLRAADEARRALTGPKGGE